MAARDGPLTPIPASQGAAMLTLFNWPRVHAHLALYPAAEKRFLGIRDGRYVGGRLGNYTDTPEELAWAVCAALERVRATIDNQTETEPFQLIPALMQAAEIGETRA